MESCLSSLRFTTSSTLWSASRLNRGALRIRTSNRMHGIASCGLHACREVDQIVAAGNSASLRPATIPEETTLEDESSGDSTSGDSKTTTTEGTGPSKACEPEDEDGAGTFLLLSVAAATRSCFADIAFLVNYSLRLYAYRVVLPLEAHSQFANPRSRLVHT
jgi:hypothetical protein